MSTDDRTEIITDRAAIRDSDEPSERGDFPYYDLGPATSETVGALDLDAIRERAKRAAWGWGAEWTAVVDDVEEWSTVHADGKRDMVGCEDGDVSRHIAGMDPATTLAIVAEVRRLAEAENDAIRAHDDLERRLADSMADADRLLIERDEACHLLRLRSDALARVAREADALRAKVAALQVAVSHSAESCADGPCEFHETVARAESAESKVAAVEALLFRRYVGSPQFEETPEHVREIDALADLYDADLASDIRAALATGEGK